MPLVVKDRVKETTTTTGTGTITLLGAVSGYQAFSVIGNTNTTYYAIVDSAAGTWEVGIGTYSTTGPTLTRDTILESSSGGTAISFAAGTKDVFCTYPAERSMYVDGTTITPATAATLPVVSGGTGASTLTANNVLLGNGTSAPLTVAPSTSGNVLTSNGTTWVSSAAPSSLIGATTSTKTTLGESAGSNITGQENTAIGRQALFSATTATSNTAIGNETLRSTTGSNNTALGHGSGYNLTTGTNNTLLGYRAGMGGSQLSTGTNNIVIGFNSDASAATVSNENTFGNSSSTSNRFWGDIKPGGSSAGTSGQVLISGGAGVSPTWGAAPAGAAATPTALGTVYGKTLSFGNTQLGYQAGNSTSGDGSTAVGDRALFTNTTSANNTAVGRSALYAATGGNNTAIGRSTGLSITTGTENTLLGRGAGFSGTNDLTTGTNNILIGYNAAATAATVSNETTIGNSSTTSARIFGKLALQNGSFAGISSTVASAATITPTSDTTNQYTVTALATGATIAIPTGTPADGQRLTIRFKDNGTARALTWTTSAGGYRVIGTTLPTTTVVSKVLYVGCIYNSQDSFWDVVSTAQEA